MCCYSMNMTETYPTTVLVSVEPSALNTVTQQVSTLKGIAFQTQVTGRFDLVIQLNTSDVQQVYQLVNQIRAIGPPTGRSSGTTCPGAARSAGGWTPD